MKFTTPEAKHLFNLLDKRIKTLDSSIESNEVKNYVSYESSGMKHAFLRHQTAQI